MTFKLPSDTWTVAQKLIALDALRDVIQGRLTDRMFLEQEEELRTMLLAIEEELEVVADCLCNERELHPVN